MYMLCILQTTFGQDYANQLALNGLSTSCVQTVYGCNVMAIALAHSSKYQLVHMGMAQWRSFSTQEFCFRFYKNT